MHPDHHVKNFFQRCTLEHLYVLVLSGVPTRFIAQWFSISDIQASIRSFVSILVDTEAIWHIALPGKETSIRSTLRYHRMRSITANSIVITSLTLCQFLAWFAWKVKYGSCFYVFTFGEDGKIHAGIEEIDLFGMTTLFRISSMTPTRYPLDVSPQQLC